MKILTSILGIALFTLTARAEITECQKGIEGEVGFRNLAMSEDAFKFQVDQLTFTVPSTDIAELGGNFAILNKQVQVVSIEGEKTSVVSIMVAPQIGSNIVKLSILIDKVSFGRSETLQCK
jgi:hypothetical protein